MTTRGTQIISDSYQNFIIDLDQQDVKRIARLLLQIRRNPDVDKIVLVFEPAQLLEGMRSLLECLQESGAYIILKKPLGTPELRSVFLE